MKKRRQRSTTPLLLLYTIIVTMLISRAALHHTHQVRALSTPAAVVALKRSTRPSTTNHSAYKINLQTLPQRELTDLITSWDYPAYRAQQISHWIRSKGITDYKQMTNLPSKLIEQLQTHTTLQTLTLSAEQISSDQTVKRAYALQDGQLIESVLMPYDKTNRYTACISSQAGCAMGCVFCATGQMGFARQLTVDEIFEQVALYHALLASEGKRLSNVVMMGMGEPLANYKNVMEAIGRMNAELGIGARRVTVSTVGLVPNIRKLIDEDLQVRLAVSLHCANDEDRSKLLPANRRYGGLDELMTVCREYIDKTKRRMTFEWALIEGENDTPEVARELGSLLRKYELRTDCVHVNLIPLNPTGGYSHGSPSGRASVAKFIQVLRDEFGLSATPRMRRGIDIDAGCGQLKAELQKQQQPEGMPVVGVFEEEEDEIEEQKLVPDINSFFDSNFEVVDLDSEGDEIDDVVYTSEEDLAECQRLIDLVKSSFPAPPQKASNIINGSIVEDTTSIVDEEAIRKAKKRRKKLLKNLKAIDKLRDKVAAGGTLNSEQEEKVAKEKEWKIELDSVEHNLK